MVQMVRPEADVEHMTLQFTLGPAYDLVLSLAAVAHPDRYELPVSWARRVRKELPVATRRDQSFFFGDPSSLGVGPVQVVPDLPGAEDPSAFIRELGALDPPDFVAALLGRRTGGRALSVALRRMARQRGVAEVDEHHVRQYAASLKAETRRRFWEMLGDPAGSRDRYVGLLRAYHDTWFASHYPEVQPFLLQRVKQGRRSIGKLPPREVVARVTGGFTLQS